MTALMQTYAYTLQSDGNRTSDLEVTYDSSGTVSSAQEFDWVYDGLDRLTSETLSTVDPATVNDPTPTVTGIVYHDSYTLDLVGNRLQKIHDVNGNGVMTDSGDEVITYVYDARDRLTSETSTTDGTTTLHGTTSYTYDDNGSMLSSDNPTTGAHTDYTYDLAGHLHTVTANGTTTTYLYDAAGNRVAELTSGGASTYYLIDANNPTGYAQELEEAATQGGPPTAAFAFGNQLIAQVKAGTLNYLLTDGHGSTRILTDDAGTVLETYTYDAYGDAVAFFRYAADGTPTAIDATTAGTTHLYSAEQFDAVSGFYNQRARWYTTSDGRFTSADTYMGRNVDPLSLHKYLYAQSNPIGNADPSGHRSLIEMVTVAGISAGLMAIGAGTLAHYAKRDVLLNAMIGAAGGLAFATAFYKGDWSVFGKAALDAGIGTALEYALDKLSPEEDGNVSGWLKYSSIFVETANWTAFTEEFLPAEFFENSAEVSSALGEAYANIAAGGIQVGLLAYNVLAKCVGNAFGGNSDKETTKQIDEAVAKLVADVGMVVPSIVVALASGSKPVGRIAKMFPPDVLGEISKKIAEHGVSAVEEAVKSYGENWLKRFLTSSAE